MAGSTFQPPIHLDPNQGSSQQTSFINQNFQTIASTLETNSFRIVSSGTSQFNFASQNVTVQTIPHNLGFAPIPFVYLTQQTFGTYTTTGNKQLPAWALTLTADIVNQQIKWTCWIDCVADETNLYIWIYNSTTTVGSFRFQYYLVQQPAS